MFKYFIFALFALVAWSGSDLFSKLGTVQNDKYSHWKVIFMVGAVMGIHAVVTIIGGLFIDPETAPDIVLSLFYTDFKPIDFLHYAPVAAIYLSAMVVGYAGLRYIELSVSSPICNSSGSLALVICVILGWASLDAPTIVGVVLISLGIIGLGVVEYFQNDEARLLRQEKSQFKYTKSFIAILIPVIYLVVDALGTVGDQFIAEKNLFDLSEYASNTAFEFTSLCFAIFAYVYVKFIKKQSFFVVENSDGKYEFAFNKYLLIGGACETVGQIFYMAVMFSDFDAGLPMISAYCVLSVLWSRIFVKEKLSALHYVAIGATIAGIILLGIFSAI